MKFLKIFRSLLLIFLFIFAMSIPAILIDRQIQRELIRHEHQIITQNGIDEDRIIEIGGIKQFINIRGQNRDNPIILFLHGGPGSPSSPIIYLYQDQLEINYTVVNWDQRNAGKTYYLNDAQKVYDTLSFNRMVEDVKEVVLYLRTEFSQDKIIILGHSWGSAIGTAFVQTYPQYVLGYIGTGQLINADEGEKLAHDKALEAAILANNQKDIDKLTNLNNYLLSDTSFSYKNFIENRKLVAKYIGNNIENDYFRYYFKSPYITFKDFGFYLKNSNNLQKPLLDELAFNYDTRDYGYEYDIPIIYIQGEYDWATPTILVEAFFQTIMAPKKEMVIIENAGHSSMIDAPNDFTAAVITSLEKIK